MTTNSRPHLWWLQIGRDRAFRSVPLWIVITALNTSVLTGLIVFRLARRDATDLPEWQLPLVLSLALVVYLLSAGMRDRYRRLDMALPLSTKSLWLVHSIALYISGLLILLASAAVIGAHFRLLSRLATFASTDDLLLGISLHLAAIWFLAVMAVQSYRTDLRKPVGRQAVLVTMALALGLVLSTALLATGPLYVAILPVAAGLGLGYRSLRCLPASFSLWPRAASEPRVGTMVGPSEIPSVGLESRRSARGLVARTLFHTPPWGPATAWIAFLFVALFGLLLSGIVRAWVPDANVRLWVATMTVYMLLAFFGPLTFRLPSLDPLPISRRYLFALLVLPAILSLVLGYAGGWLTQKLLGDPTRSVQYRVELPYYWVSVPYDQLKIAWDGDVPELTSPWGETHAPSSGALFRGAKAMLYSPFNTPEESSAAFEALLTSRAVESTYGTTIPHAEILERYFEVEDDRVVGLKGGGLTLEQDYPQLGPPTTSPQFLPLMTLVLVPWFCFLAIFLRTFRANLGDRTRQVTFWSLLGLSLLAMLGQVALTLTRWARPDVLRGAIEVVLRQVNDTTLGAFVLTGVCLALLLVSYRLAERQLQKAEIPAAPTKVALLDFSQEY